MGSVSHSSFLPDSCGRGWGRVGGSRKAGLGRDSRAPELPFVVDSPPPDCCFVDSDGFEILESRNTHISYILYIIDKMSYIIDCR